MLSYVGNKLIHQNIAILGINDRKIATMASLNASNARDQLSKMDADDCVKAYSKPFQSSYRNIFAVVDPVGNEIGNETIHSTYTAFPQNIVPYTWICDGVHNESIRECDVRQFLDHGVVWSLGGRNVSYCLAEPVTDLCEVSFHRTLIIVVIVVNAAKLMAMLALLNFFNEATLVTLGDAIRSFVEDPDDTTTGMCLSNWRSFRLKDAEANNLGWARKEKKYSPTEFQTSWFWTSSTGQWVRTIGIIHGHDNLLLVMLSGYNRYNRYAIAGLVITCYNRPKSWHLHRLEKTIKS